MPDLTDIHFEAEQLMTGAGLYGRFCGQCHGANAVGGGVIPDLRYSAFLSQAQAWHQVVRGGSLANNGMASFADEITEEGSEAIRMYVVSRNQFAHRIGDTRRLSR